MTTTPTVLPSETGPATPIGSTRYRRTIPSTAIGDPATADLCTSLDLAAFTDQTAVFGDQPLGACDLYSKAADGTYVVFVNVSSPGDPAPSGGTRSVVEGMSVIAYPITGGHCSRRLMASGVLLDVSTSATSTPAPAAAELCGAADTLTKQLALDITGRLVPRLHLGSATTITHLAPCPALAASAAARIMGDSRVRTYALYFDTGCEWLAANGDELSAEMYLFTSNPTDNGMVITSGGHQLTQRIDTRLGVNCYADSFQGLTIDDQHEVLEIDLSTAAASAPTATTCHRATQAAVTLLDALQLA